MAKKDKKEEVKTAAIPEGVKAYKKLGGGSLRFQNRIIKPGQRFCINPDALPTSFKNVLEEVDYVEGMLIIETNVPIKKVEAPVVPIDKSYGIKKAKDGDKIIKDEKGNILWNVVANADGKVVSENPLPKGKAQQLADTMNN